MNQATEAENLGARIAQDAVMEVQLRQHDDGESLDAKPTGTELSELYAAYGPDVDDETRHALEYGYESVIDQARGEAIPRHRTYSLWETVRQLYQCPRTDSTCFGITIRVAGVHGLSPVSSASRYFSEE